MGGAVAMVLDGGVCEAAGRDGKVLAPKACGGFLVFKYKYILLFSLILKHYFCFESRSKSVPILW